MVDPFANHLLISELVFNGVSKAFIDLSENAWLYLGFPSVFLLLPGCPSL
jgi:hypothetical protein